ncbi:MAG: hypothetical protein QHH07_07480 [Sedimentisphaerales bacterium]|nr:hypothetical protein [Sedimentisphaerales bacterium]
MEAVPSQILGFGVDPNGIVTRAVRLIDHQRDPNQGLVLEIGSLTTDRGTSVRLISARQVSDGLELQLELGPIREVGHTRSYLIDC